VRLVPRDQRHVVDDSARVAVDADGVEPDLRQQVERLSSRYWPPVAPWHPLVSAAVSMAVVNQMRSPSMTGVECPRPGNGVFQAMFSDSDQVSGKPLAPGP